MDTWTLISNRMTQLKDMHERMDKTRDLVYLEPYQLKNFQGQKIDNVISVTGNKAAVFGNTIIADLVQAKWQTVVEGEISSRAAHNIEQFIENNLQQADEYLLEKYGLAGLYEWLCNHVCIRGPIGVEWYEWLEGDKYNIHCLPLDMRWAPFQHGSQGLKWVAPITYRSKEDLEEEFPESKGRITGTTDIEVRDFWDGEKNEVWIDKQLIKTEKNPFGKPPFVIVFPPSGFMLRDKGYIKHEAEDIFFMIRGLNDELNRSLSIEQSIGMDILYPPYEQEVDVLTSEPAQPPPKTGETIKVKKGERHQPLQRGDLNRASQVARQDIYRMIDEGAPISPRSYRAPPSGAELLAEMEALARLQNSRIVALRVFREQLARLMIDQYITLGGEGQSIGKRGRRQVYSVAQLKDPDTYSISCQLMTTNKRQELANLAMFAAAYGRLPLKYNLTNILKVEDPDGVMRELEIEQAKKADPVIALFEMARRYAQEAAELEDVTEADARKIQSKMLTERAVAIVRQRKQPAPLPEKARVPEVEQPTGGTQTLLPLLAGGGMGGGASRAETEEEI